MRIQISRYNPEKEKPVFPNRPDPRKQDLVVLRLLIILLAVFFVFLIVNGCFDLNTLHQKTGILQDVEPISSVSRHSSRTVALNLTIDGEVYKLSADYIRNDGDQYRIDHADEMEWFLNRYDVMNYPIDIQYVQEFPSGNREVVSMCCEKALLVDMDYSMQVRQSSFLETIIASAAALAIAILLYILRRNYSISIQKSAK